jgi:RNA polymerase sigma factor (sigma-70 family)
VTPAEPATAQDERDDGEDFVAFYRRAYPAAKRLAHLLMSGSVDAEDVVQDAFAQLHRRYATLDHPDRYLRRAVVNGTKQRFRARSREHARLRLVAGGRAESTSTPEPLLDAVAALPHRQRAAIVLRYWAGLGDDEIADALGARRATVRSLVHRGIQQLRKDLPQ